MSAQPINDGGPAFPMEWRNDTGADILVGSTVIHHGEIATCLGASLRDYFAAKALQALIPIPGLPVDKAMVAKAFEIADWMLAERSKA